MKINLLNLMIKIFTLVVLVFISSFSHSKSISEDIVYGFFDNDRKEDKLYYKCYSVGDIHDGPACKVNIETAKNNYFFIAYIYADHLIISNCGNECISITQFDRRGNDIIDQEYLFNPKLNNWILSIYIEYDGDKEIDVMKNEYKDQIIGIDGKTYNL